MEKAPLLFDFDGVIADTFHIAHGVAKKMCVYLTETEYKKGFEGNIYDAHKTITAEDHGDRCDHLLDWFGEFAPHFKLGARPFEGMPELLQRFAKDRTLCIVSSTQSDLIAHFLEKYGLSGTVSGVYGADVNTRKDEKFRMIFSKYGVTPSECVFVTDTLGDINEATSVELSSIGVTWGFQNRETLARGNPVAIVDRPDELPVMIERYFSSLE